MIDVPHVVGLTKEKAKSLIEKEGLVAVFEDRDLTAADKFYEKGYVVAQEPNANTSGPVPEGTSIKVYVSTGVTNYNYKTTVDIRDDFTDYSKSGYVSIWYNGDKVDESGELDFNKKSSYTFDEMTSFL